MNRKNLFSLFSSGKGAFFFSGAMLFIAAVAAFFIGSWNSAFATARVPFEKVETLTTQSQWFIPLSPWKVSDEILYIYSGVKLVQGALPWQTSPEVPPLGKLFIGLSQTIFQNPYVVNWGFLIATLIAFYLIIRLVTTNPVVRSLSLLFVVSSPLFIAQFSQALLEPQLGFFCLAFLYCFLLALRSFRSTHAVGAGVFLGLMAACKFPLFAGVYAMLGVVVLWMQSKKQAVLFASGILAGYLGAYGLFFVRGYSFVSWLHGQWWMIQFYRHGGTEASVAELLPMLLLGSSSTEVSLGSLREWTPLWIVQLLIFIWMLWQKAYAKLSKNTQLIVLFFAVTMGLHFVSPFVLRYFYHTQFLLFLLVTALLQDREQTGQKTWGLCLLLFVAAVLGLLRFGFFGPTDITASFAQRYSVSNYAELDVHLEQRPWVYNPDRTSELRNADEGAQILKRSLRFQTIPPVLSLSSAWTGKALVSLKLIQGNTLSYEVPIIMERSGTQWKVRWSDDLIFPGYRHGCSIESSVEDSASFSPWYGWLRLERTQFIPTVDESLRLSEIIQHPQLTLFHDFFLKRGDQEIILWPIVKPNTIVPPKPGMSVFHAAEDKSPPQLRRNAIYRTLSCPEERDSE